MIEIVGFTFGIVEILLLAGFILAFFVQLFYQLLMSIFTLRGKRRIKPSVLPSISVIVPSRNYEENLRELIPSLLEQDYPDFEVVVVDDCSSDGTEWYLAGLKLESDKLKTSRIIQETDFPNALVITIGVRAATKEWLIFLNPLCRVSGKNWLSSVATGMHPEAETLFGFVKYSNSEGSMQKLFRYENFNSFVLYGAARYLGLPMPVNEVNIAYKREQFLNLKGFAAVLDSRFSENELYINKLATRKNSSFLFDRSSSVTYYGDTDWHDGMIYKKKQILLRKKFTFSQKLFLSVNGLSRIIFDATMVALLIISPWRFWVAGVWLFKMINELIWGVVAMNRIGEKNLFPGLLILRSTLPFVNGFISFKQIFRRRKRKWK